MFVSFWVGWVVGEIEVRRGDDVFLFFGLGGLFGVLKRCFFVFFYSGSG